MAGGKGAETLRGSLESCSSVRSGAEGGSSAPEVWPGSSAMAMELVRGRLDMMAIEEGGIGERWGEGW